MLIGVSVIECIVEWLFNDEVFERFIIVGFKVILEGMIVMDNERK